MNNKASLMAAGALAACFLNTAALAGPEEHVFSPIIETGEREIELNFGRASTKNQPSETAAVIGIGYGVNQYWATELELKYKREPNDAGEQRTFHDAVEWENRFALTEAGKYPVDVGFVLEIERPRDHSEGWEVVFGPLFQTEFDKLQLNLNLLGERHFRAVEKGETEFKYQWQAKYRLSKAFEFGLQGFGEPEEHLHNAGPAIFGKLPLGDHQALKYNAAYLIGTSQDAPDNTFRFTLEYEF